MLTKLLYRSVASVHERLVLLAPPDAALPSSFENVDLDPDRHARLLTEMQRLRGTVYLHDGAVEAKQLSIDGLHQTPEDDRSWHLLMVDRLGRIDACCWYMEHKPTVTIDRLRVRNSPLMSRPESRDLVTNAVALELARAKEDGIGFAEVGGWAVAEGSRCTSEGLVLALAGYSLGRILGGTIAMTTATVRHCSSTILRRLGGSDLRVGADVVPTYYDPKYKCEMELLRFDSRHPSAKYASLVEMLKHKLSDVLVISRAPAQVVEPAFSFVRPSVLMPRPLVATT